MAEPAEVPTLPTARALFEVLGRRLAVPLHLSFERPTDVLDAALADEDSRVQALFDIARRAHRLHARSIDAVLTPGALRVAVDIDTPAPTTGTLHAAILGAFGVPLDLQRDTFVSIPPPGGDAPSVTAASRVAIEWLARIQAMEAECVFGEDPEGPHQMRVAVRRLRTVLRLLARQPHVKSLSVVETRVRALGDLAGSVRDHDVVLARIEKLTLADDARRAAEKYLRGRRARTLDRMRKVLLSPNVAASIEDARLRLAALTEIADQRPMNAAGREHFDRTFRQFVRQCGEGIVDGEAYHTLRRRIRRVRDCIEVFGAVLRKSDHAWRKRLQPVQSLLGNLNDIETAMRLVPASLKAAAPVHAALERQRLDTLTELAVPLTLTVVTALRR